MATLPISQVLRMGRGDRALFVGMTGSGKTTLAMVLLWRAPRLLLVDTANRNPDWRTEPWSPAVQERLEVGEPVRIRTVYPTESLAAMEAVYNVGNGIVYVDEVTHLIPQAQRVPQVVVDVWTRGRVRGVGGWAATQRPVSIPLIMVSEAEHQFVFKLNRLDDRKLLADNIGDKRLVAPILPKHAFYYYNIYSNELLFLRLRT